MSEGKKTCADCVNSDEFFSEREGKTIRCCETVGWGVPCLVSPPYDKPCQFYSETDKFDIYEFVSKVNDMDD